VQTEIKHQGKNSLRGLLAACYAFPPIKRIGSVRNYHIVRYLGEKLGYTHVLTTGNRRFLQEEPFPLDGIAVDELKTWDFRNILRGDGKARTITEEDKTRSGHRFFMKILFSFPFNLLLGEGGFLYILSGYRQGKKLVRSGKVTHLFSSYRPYSDHFICFLLKRKFPFLVWIADFRDLHLDPILDQVILKRFQKWCNRKILARADLVTTVSHGLARHLKAFNSNVYVLRNGIPAPYAKAPLKYKQFTICYTGSLFQDYRDPTPLFDVLKGLILDGSIHAANIRIVYAGKDGDLFTKWIEEYDLGKIFTNAGHVSMAEAKQIQMQSHLNLLLTYASNELVGNMTGKFYDYLSTGNPIIAIIKGARDTELETMISDLDAGISIYPDESGRDALKSLLLKMYRQWKDTGHLTFSYNTGKLRELHWPEQMEGLFHKLGLKGALF
jgi:hypothetical protein